MFYKESDGNGWHADEEVVHRTIDGDWQVIRVRLTDTTALRSVPMYFDQEFEHVDRILDIWRAAGRIERHGHLEHIEIEVAQETEFSARLRVLPWKAHRNHLHISHQ